MAQNRIAPGYKGLWNLRIVVIVLSLLASHHTAFAQTASDFFQQGMNASSLDIRIAALERAVQADPNYIEAYFYLGLAYKSKGVYQQAEIMLNKAYFTNPYGLNGEIKMRILYELGSVHALLGKNQEARDALRGAKELAQNNKNVRGRIAFELGQVYIKQGEYDSALRELREARELLPQNRVKIDQVISQAADGQELGSKYREAEALMASEKYREAQRLLREIAAVDADFKDVAERLGTIQSELQKKNAEQNLAALYDRASAAARRGSLQQAVRFFEQIVRADPDYRDAAQRLQQLRAQADDQNRNNSLEKTYDEAVAAIRKKQWRQALRQLAAVQQIEPGYRNVSALIDQANQALATLEKREAPKEQLYGQALAAIETENWRQALQLLRQLQALDPGYKDIQQQLLRIKEGVAERKALYAVTDSLFQQGLAATQAKDWLAAVLAFEKVRMLDPAYQDIENKLAEARLHLSKSGGKTVGGESAGFTVFLWAGAGISLMLIPIAVVIVFSPTMRARVYLLQGKNLMAAELYEEVLAKRPQRVKLYPILANIYLLENRRDEKAIRVFETMLKLDIYTPQRAEINSIVANYYLSQGRTDGNAITVMERELDNKLKNLKSGVA